MRKCARQRGKGLSRQARQFLQAARSTLTRKTDNIQSSGQMIIIASPEWVKYRMMV
jgi:hypothetical protein